MVGEALMPYQMKPLACDLPGSRTCRAADRQSLREQLRRSSEGPNLIEEQLAELDYAKAAGFLVNGLKREQLIAMN
jgi:Fe-Mn family superoxide dismutase